MKGRYSEWNFYGERVRVRIEGFRIDRLLDQATKAGISFKNLRMISDTEAECWVSVTDNTRLKKLLHSRYRLTTVENRGPHAVLKRTARNYMMVISGIIILVGVIWQSRIIGKIQIEGYRAIPESQLLACLEEQGIRLGAYIPEISWREARKSVYDTFPQITWIQLVYDGRTVLLRISETDHQSFEEAQKERIAKEGRGCCDIVASQSGYIYKVEARWGETRVVAGDYVEKGQILIGGCIPIQSTTYEEDAPTEYFVCAQGNVWADVEYRVSFNQERFLLSQQRDEDYGEGAYAEAGDEGSAEAGGRTGSAGEGGGTVLTNKVERTDREAEIKANQQIRTWAKNNLPENCKIINKGLKFLRKENIIEVDVTLVVRQEIGIEQEIAFGETEGIGAPNG